MNWYRINTSDGNSAFYEIDLSVNKMFEEIEGNHAIKVNRMIILVPQDHNGKQGVMAIQRKEIDPMSRCCDESKEFICPSNIISFGLVNVESEIWDKISESALRESKIIKPKLLVP